MGKYSDTIGEQLVEKVLIEAGGILIHPYRMNAQDCKHLSGASFLYAKQVKGIDDTRFIFDFYVYSKFAIAIEYDGEFHFRPISSKKNINDIFHDFFKRHNYDLNKDEYCEDSETPLLRIRYDQKDQIEYLVKDVLLNPIKYITAHNPEWDNYYNEWTNNFNQLYSNLNIERHE